MTDGQGDNNKSNRLDSFSPATRWIMVRFMVCPPPSPPSLIISCEGIKGLTKRGICFTYATMFDLESLAIAGETHENSAAVRRACDFLVSKQMEDGGWGETYMVSISLIRCHYRLTLLPSIFIYSMSFPLLLTIVTCLLLSPVSSLTL